jgi:hypothetical protein
VKTEEKDMKTRKNSRVLGVVLLAAFVLYLPLEASAQRDLLGDSARGAAKGALIGAIAGDAGKGPQQGLSEALYLGA